MLYNSTSVDDRCLYLHYSAASLLHNLQLFSKPAAFFHLQLRFRGLTEISRLWWILFFSPVRSELVRHAAAFCFFSGFSEQTSLGRSFLFLFVECSLSTLVYTLFAFAAGVVNSCRCSRHWLQKSTISVGAPTVLRMIVRSSKMTF